MAIVVDGKVLRLALMKSLAVLELTDCVPRSVQHTYSLSGTQLSSAQPTFDITWLGLRFCPTLLKNPRLALFVDTHNAIAVFAETTVQSDAGSRILLDPRM